MTRLLGELLALAPTARAAHLSARGAPLSAALPALIEACERQTLTRVQDALPITQMLVDLSDEFDIPAARARSRRARAQALAYAGRFDDSLAACSDAIAVAVSAGLPIEAARARLASMHALGELGRYDEAIAAGTAAQQEFTRAGETSLAAYADVNLGIIHQNRDDPRTALVHFDRARLALAHEPIRVAWIDNNSGEALLLVHEFDAAEAAFRSSLETSAAAGATLAAAIAEGNLADLLARRGDAQPALDHFERARRRLEKDAARSHLARLVAEQAEALELLGMSEQAATTFEGVLPELDSLGLTAEAARARAGLGRALMRLERLTDAEAPLAAACAAFEQLGQAPAAARANHLRARLALAAGRFDLSESLIESAAHALRDRPADTAALDCDLAALKLAAGAADDAAPLLERALPVAASLGLRHLSADLLHTRARLHTLRGDSTAAIADLRAAVDCVEHARASLHAERFRAAFLGSRNRLFEDLAAALLDQPSPAIAEAFNAVERGRSRALLDVVRGAINPAECVTATESGVDSPLMDEIRHASGELNLLFSQFSEGRISTSPAAAADWRERVRACEARLQALENRLAATAAGSGSAARVESADQIAGCLDVDIAVVEYASIREECVAFVIRREGLQCVRGLASLSETDRLVERVRFQVSRAARTSGDSRAAALVADAQRSLHALYDAIFRPLLPALAGTTRLVFVPHGSLHLAPLHALWDGERYLAETHEISYAPSASLLAHSLVRREISDARPLVIGFGDAAAPQIEREALEVADLLPQSRRFFRADATTGAFFETSGSANVVHFACHGRFSAASPLSSGLRLADGWLTVRDVIRTRLPARLVVLSGCDTGRSLVQGGDELFGFLRAFLSAGAAAVIASQWIANDAKSRQFMRDIYVRWYNSRERVRLSAAVSQAYRDLIRDNPHPMFWAPFILVGTT